MSTDQEPASPLEWDVFKKILDAMVVAIAKSNNASKKVTMARYMVGIAIGGYTGLRGGEILTVKWSDVLDKNKFLKQVLKSRGKKKKRDIEMNENLIKIVKVGYDAVQPESIELPILINKAKNPISIQGFNKYLKKYLATFGVKTVVSSHTLRKTFGKRVFVKNGSSEDALILVNQLLAHKSLEDTKRYIGLTEQKLKKAYLDLD